MASDDGFLSRWSRRKAQVARGEPVPQPPAPSPAGDAPAGMPNAARDAAPKSTSQPLPPTPAPVSAQVAPAEPPAPTMADVELLTRESDYARFVARNVDTDVKNAALKKLFTDPHFNVMDGLDTYIDDYGIPDPLPAGMLRQMAQSHFLGLFADEKAPGAKTEAERTASDPSVHLQAAPVDDKVDAADEGDANADADAEGATDPTAPAPDAATHADATLTTQAPVALPSALSGPLDQAFAPPATAFTAITDREAVPRAEAPASPTFTQPAIPAKPLPDEDPDLRLQPDDDARRAILEPRAREDARRRS